MAARVQILLLFLGLTQVMGGFGVSVAFARFLEPDADVIDEEQRLSFESYNDKLSYRFPTPWLKLWDDASAGYRISAGSLNFNRFNIDEDIKIIAQGTAPVSFSFHHNRREDMVAARLEQVLRIDWLTPLADLNLAIMAEGGTYKQYGDIGGAIGYRPRRDRLVEVYYWSVDHFYASKKDYEDDSRSRDAATTGLRADWRFSPAFRIRADHQYDKPLRWDRKSRDYLYEYWRRVTDVRLDFGDSSSAGGYVSLFAETKEEGKHYYLEDDASHSKAMHRDVRIFETGYYQVVDTTTWTVGVTTIDRAATYKFAASEGVEPDSYIEKPHPTPAHRQELGLFLETYFGGGRLFNTQLGLHTNHVEEFEGTKDKRSTEAKLQTAWDALITDKARILLNLTWDLDQLQQDFPYEEESPFRPWGGGNIQFLGVF